MPLYKYTAKDRDGNKYEHTFDAESKIELYGHIREEGGVPISIREAKSIGGMEISLKGFFGGIKTHDKIIFARNLGSMINAGLSVTRALSVMEKQAKSKTLKKLMTDLLADINRGEPLSDAMKKRPKIFSSLFVSMVRAGEESGNMAGSL